MPLSPAKFLPYEAKTIILKVHSYENKNITGYLSNVMQDSDERFDNLTQMLFGIEKILDDNQFPQPNLETRTFPQAAGTSGKPKPVQVEKSEDSQESGTPIASFKLSVMFRQNASWQGNLVKIDNNTAAQFRSVFELIQLLDSVL